MFFSIFFAKFQVPSIKISSRPRSRGVKGSPSIVSSKALGESAVAPGYLKNCIEGWVSKPLSEHFFRFSFLWRIIVVGGIKTVDIAAIEKLALESPIV
jgi:hypothetical protein